MKYFMRPFVVLMVIFSSMMIVTAQDEDSNVTVLNCTNGEGCIQTESSLTQEEAEIVLGEVAPEGDDAPFVVCSDGLGCVWSRVTAEEVDLVFGGDGVDDLVFDEDEGLEIITEDDLEFDEDEGTVIEDEDELIFTEEEVLEFQEALCNDNPECSWIDLSPEEIDTLFPEFEGVAYLIVPRAGTWQGVSHPPVLAGCPATVNEMLAGYTVSDSGTIDMGDSFDISVLMDIPGSTVSNPVPNIYSIVYSPDPSVVVGFVYHIVSDEYIQANMLFRINVPGVMVCSATVDFEFEYDWVKL